MSSYTQNVYDCEMVYDLTEHSITVLDGTGTVRLKVWRVPDTPPDFTIEEANDHSMVVNNPNGFDFLPMPDNAEFSSPE